MSVSSPQSITFSAQVDNKKIDFQLTPEKPKSFFGKVFSWKNNFVHRQADQSKIDYGNINKLSKQITDNIVQNTKDKNINKNQLKKIITSSLKETQKNLLPGDNISNELTNVVHAACKKYFEKTEKKESFFKPNFIKSLFHKKHLSLEQKLKKNLDQCTLQQKKESAENKGSIDKHSIDISDDGFGDKKTFMNAIKETSETETIEKYEIGVCNFKNERHHSQQDAYSKNHSEISVGGKNYPFTLCGVYDGHGDGGQTASKFVKDTALKYFKAALEETTKNSQNVSDQEIIDALKKCCDDLHKDYTGPEKSGTTATFSLFINGKAFVANVGDSRTIAVNNAKDANYNTQQLSLDAKLDEKRFAKSVKKRGGKIVSPDTPRLVDKDGNAAVNMARTIGDKHITKGKVPKPTITCIDLKDIKDGFFILASDDLTDRCTTDAIGKTVRKMAAEKKEISPLEMAKNLTYGSKRKEAGNDDITVMVIKLPPSTS